MPPPPFFPSLSGTLFFDPEALFPASFFFSRFFFSHSRKPFPKFPGLPPCASPLDDPFLSFTDWFPLHGDFFFFFVLFFRCSNVFQKKARPPVRDRFFSSACLFPLPVCGGAALFLAEGTLAFSAFFSPCFYTVLYLDWIAFLPLPLLSKLSPGMGVFFPRRLAGFFPWVVFPPLCLARCHLSPPAFPRRLIMRGSLWRNSCRDAFLFFSDSAFFRGHHHRLFLSPPSVFLLLSSQRHAGDIRLHGHCFPPLQPFLWDARFLLNTFLPSSPCFVGL